MRVFLFAILLSTTVIIRSSRWLIRISVRMSWAKLSINLQSAVEPLQISRAVEA